MPASIRAVRRFLAIVLLVFMPLQFSWAEVETYCALEAQAQVEHFGYHEHLQQVVDAVDTADTADVADTSTAAAATSDTDCSHCHCHCPAMLGDAAGAHQKPSNARPSAALDAAGRAHASARPERPQWLRLA